MCDRACGESTHSECGEGEELLFGKVRNEVHLYFSVGDLEGRHSCEFVERSEGGDVV